MRMGARAASWRPSPSHAAAVAAQAAAVDRSVSLGRPAGARDAPLSAVLAYSDAVRAAGALADDAEAALGQRGALGSQRSAMEAWREAGARLERVAAALASLKGAIETTTKTTPTVPPAVTAALGEVSGALRDAQARQKRAAAAPEVVALLAAEAGGRLAASPGPANRLMREFVDAVPPAEAAAEAGEATITGWAESASVDFRRKLAADVEAARRIVARARTAHERASVKYSGFGAPNALPVACALKASLNAINTAETLGGLVDKALAPLTAANPKRRVSLSPLTVCDRFIAAAPAAAARAGKAAALVDKLCCLTRCRIFLSRWNAIEMTNIAAAAHARLATTNAEDGNPNDPATLLLDKAGAALDRCAALKRACCAPGALFDVAKRFMRAAEEAAATADEAARGMDSRGLLRAQRALVSDYKDALGRLATAEEGLRRLREALEAHPQPSEAVSGKLRAAAGAVAKAAASRDAIARLDDVQEAAADTVGRIVDMRASSLARVRDFVATVPMAASAAEAAGTVMEAFDTKFKAGVLADLKARFTEAARALAEAKRALERARSKLHSIGAPDGSWSLALDDGTSKVTAESTLQDIVTARTDAAPDDVPTDVAEKMIAAMPAAAKAAAAAEAAVDTEVAYTRLWERATAAAAAAAPARTLLADAREQASGLGYDKVRAVCSVQGGAAGCDLARARAAGHRRWTRPASPRHSPWRTSSAWRSRSRRSARRGTRTACARRRRGWPPSRPRCGVARAPWAARSPRQTRSWRLRERGGRPWSRRWRLRAARRCTPARRSAGCGRRSQRTRRRTAGSASRPRPRSRSRTRTSASRSWRRPRARSRAPRPRSRTRRTATRGARAWGGSRAL